MQADDIAPTAAAGRSWSPEPLYRSFVDWAHRHHLERKLSIALLVLALVSGVATFIAMSGSFGMRTNPRVVLLLLLGDLVVLLALGTVVARRLVILWLERRRGLSGARLHARLVMLFSLLAVTPTIIIALFSTLFLNLGMEAWFSDRVRTAVHDSLVVARAYLEEHQRNIGGDVLAMAEDLRREGPFLMINRQRFERLMDFHVRARGLNEAVLINSQAQVLASAGFNLVMEFDPELPNWAIARAHQGDLVLLPSDTGDRVRALVQLDPVSDTYLYVGRLVDPRVIAHLNATEGAAQLYEELEGRRSGLQITFVLIFIVIALLMLLAAVWLALIVATQLARPIGDLVSASERISQGDLAARVPEGAADDEIGALSRTFNRMTGQLESQHNELVSTNRELDERRRFTELVLSGVSAGVIGLDDKGRIQLPNRSASLLLHSDLVAAVGKPLGELIPELAPVIEQGRRRLGRPAEGQIQITRGSETRTMIVRVVSELDEGDLIRLVVTVDDVTELMSAQRKAAWADVARRIAHEIKNPLTPIQLSAERLKRKYLKEITSDPEAFMVCTDTIVRQVGDIGRMVDEFSSFARMPAPVLRPENLLDLCRQALFLQRTANPAVQYHTRLPDEPVIVVCDSRQVSQALTNLLQNAIDAIDGRQAQPGETLPRGEIELSLEIETDKVILSVADNGRGLPSSGRERLTEPYVTTRAKGTGLGLAIVKKIMEDHGGQLQLSDREGGGAVVRLLFPTGAERAAEPPADLTSKSMAHGT
jgi:two-component system nitrogen regulation sensor histidine kinase NtrY